MTRWNTAELRAAFVAKLKESGLSVSDAKALGFERYSEDDARQRFPQFPAPQMRSGFLMPYRNLDGKQSGFARWCNLDRAARGFGALTEDGKKGPAHYLQPLDSCPELFLPFLPRMPWKWRDVATDVEQSLLITEGELKACSALKLLALPCIGLGGIWNFGAKRQNAWLLDSFFWFEWKKRELYHIADSDAITNPAVRAAQLITCARLAAFGPRIFPLILPSLPGLKKTGLDDFLLHSEGGKQRLLELMKQTPELPGIAELHAMNEIAVYVREVSQIYIPEEDIFLKPADFVNNYRTRSYAATTGAGEKQRIEQKIVPREWLGWKVRHEAKSVTFDPTAPPLQITPADAFNMFPGLPRRPARGDTTPWNELMDWMFPAQPDLRAWFLNWAAYPIQAIEAGQEPKMHSCAALISVAQGSGKGLVGQTLGKLYGKFFSSIGTRELGAEFNDWAKNKLFILGNEITGKQHAEFADDIKALITEETFWLHPKHVKRIDQPNHMNFLFTSNNYDAFFVSFSDRRFFVHAAPECKILDAWGREKLNAYIAWRESADGQAALLWEMLHRRISNSWDHRDPPNTAAKYTLQSASANLAERWLRDIAGTPALLPESLQKRLLWTAEELLAQFRADTHDDGYSSAGMGKALGLAQWFRVLEGEQIRNLGTKQKPLAKRRLWARPDMVEEAKKLTTERAVAKRFNEERGFKTQEQSVAAHAAQAQAGR